jgi:hypothetical protein
VTVIPFIAALSLFSSRTPARLKRLVRVILVSWAAHIILFPHIEDRYFIRLPSNRIHRGSASRRRRLRTRQPLRRPASSRRKPRSRARRAPRKRSKLRHKQLRSEPPSSRPKAAKASSFGRCILT